MSTRRISSLWCAALWLGALAPQPSWGQVSQRVKDTVHNLSVSGPGRIRAAAEREVCVFCHTPHGAADVRPLWNRSVPPTPYVIYESFSLRARPTQPTGSSKLCLSCHDGTIALGSVLSRPTPIAMAGATQTIPPGSSNLGTDLTDDHPISFSYAASLTGTSELLPPEAIVFPVKLDGAGQMQCTSCHDAHDNSLGDFLVRTNADGALCESCHRIASWRSSSHARSSAVVPADLAAILGADATSVGRNACKSCHRPHHAGGKPWILHRPNIAATCVSCHNGTVASNILSEFNKFSSHGMSVDGMPEGVGTPYIEGTRVSCADCHNVHATGSSESLTPGMPPSLARVAGVNLIGAPVAEASFEHEICFRCHGDAPARVGQVLVRQIFQPNKRLQFQLGNPSYHPVGNPGANPSVTSLIPPLRASSTIACGDCHTSDDSRTVGGTGPAGPHGSMFRPLLGARYDTADFSIESSQAYGLCYRCHLRESILGDRSFAEHQKHVVEEKAPCSVCHDPHGIYFAQGSGTGNTHLINFDRTVVFPTRGGRLEFVDLGTNRGSCSLTCHGKEHNPENYPD